MITTTKEAKCLETNNGGRANERRTCPVAGCPSCQALGELPMCAKHWTSLDRRFRELIVGLLPTASVLAYRVAVELAVEKVNGVKPYWASGWAGENRRRIDRAERIKRADVGRAATCRRIRDDVRRRPDYDERAAAWTETLESLVETLGRFSATDIALAMIRGGHGTEGFCPYLIAAALDLDERDAE